jgi:hypothetical protein
MTDQPHDRDTKEGTGALNGKSEPLAYYAYLLRLWRVTEMGRPPPKGQPAVWRASLQAARNNEILGFASLDGLFDFLRRQMHMSPDGDADEDEATAQQCVR